MKNMQLKKIKKKKMFIVEVYNPKKIITKI